jgi:PPM family protein phosphatase
MNLTEIYYLHEIGGKKNQEDYIWPVPGTASPDDKIFIVCDGVGGAENGEIASKIVAQSVGTSLLKTATREIDTPFINQLLSDARQKLIDYAGLHKLSTHMATTFSLLIFIDEKAFISWCGDSRVYHIRNGEILFKTDDHSLVNTLVKSGEITAEEAQSHPQKNMLLKAINADEPDPEADGHWTDEVLDGDYFMLCTDGLLENISDRDIKFLLVQNDKGSIDLVQSVQKFCYDKTRDNYSMYLVKVKKEEKEAPKKKKGAFRWLVFLLILVLAAAAFVIKENYFVSKKVMNVVVPVNINKDSMENADSILRANTIAHEKDTIRGKDTTHIKDSAHPVPVPVKTQIVLKDTTRPASSHPDSAGKRMKAANKPDSSRTHMKMVPKKDSASNPAQALK